MRIILGDTNRLVSPLATSLRFYTLSNPLTTCLMVILMHHCTLEIHLVTMLILNPRKPFNHHIEPEAHISYTSIRLSIVEIEF